MSNGSRFRALVEGTTDRRGLGPLLAALGLEPIDDPVPRGAWPSYGLAEAEGLREMAVVGRSGTLDALLLELAGPLNSERVTRLARRVRGRNPSRLHLFVVASSDWDRMVLGLFDLQDTFQHLLVEWPGLRMSDIEALEEMAPANGEAGLQLAVRHARALDRSRITRRFYLDFRTRRTAVADEWTGLPVDAVREREQLALLFLSRLTFLYFLQKRGALAGDDRYLPSLFGQWMAHAATGTGAGAAASFYRARLRPLFFGALNRRPEDRSKAARALGELPYLNGGLFERHALERRFVDLDLPDETVRHCFDDLLERYRFTSREAEAGSGHGVDPEILGRVFEGLMAPGDRSDTGTFYTPASVVKRVVAEAVATYVGGACSAGDARRVVNGCGSTLPAETRYRVRSALERIRVLDPACGSGAFLLGALQRIGHSLASVSEEAPGEIRRRIVARSLHGVDLLDDAALLCSLRLWLALSQDDDEVRPLPNLDRRIRQGDALVDPLDLAATSVGWDGNAVWHPLEDAGLRQALRSLEPVGRKYVESAPEDRERLRARIDRAEGRLARRWVEGARRVQRERLRQLRARAADRDLFGDVPRAAREAGAAVGRTGHRLDQLDRMAKALDERGTLPFFSFGVHFSDAVTGFDLIVSNPPWVRSHRWNDRIRRLADRFEVCRDPGWAGAADLTGSRAGAGAQVDLSLLFLERAIRLLAPGGVLAILIPAKAIRALYGGAARRMILRELELTLVEDHALDQRSVFRADAFTAILIGRKRDRGSEPGDVTGNGPAPGSPVSTGSTNPQVRTVRRGQPPLEYRVRSRDLPLFPDDPSSPWLVAPSDTVAVFRRMQAAGTPLGQHPDMTVRRGIMTGANDVLLFSSVEPKLSGLALVEAEGYERARRAGVAESEAERFRGVVELAGLRPIIRGADVDAFRYDISTWTTWCHGPDAEPAQAPDRLRKYLEGHRNRLERRTGWREGISLGSVFRVSPDTLRPKVAWHDLSDTVRAVALPGTIRVAGAERDLIPLNTVYFLPTSDYAGAVLLAGLLNSLPVRTMARSFAERAKDARFRFFAWTMSALPLPVGWRTDPAAPEIRRLSERGHARGGLDDDEAHALDEAVGRLYRLGSADMDSLRRFDAWLRGCPEETTTRAAP